MPTLNTSLLQTWGRKWGRITVMFREEKGLDCFRHSKIHFFFFLIKFLRLQGIFIIDKSHSFLELFIYYFINSSTKCRKTIKNATFLVFFCYKISSFNITHDKEKQQILPIKKDEWNNQFIEINWLCENSKVSGFTYVYSHCRSCSYMQVINHEFQQLVLNSADEFPIMFQFP